MDFFGATMALENGESLPLAIIGGIAFGVIGKYFYDYAVQYFKAADKGEVRWDWQGFLITCIVSGFIGVLLYGIVLEKVSRLDGFWLVASSATQAGFFSQALIGELGKKYE